MKLKPYPHQISGAEHLAARVVAALYDDPRVGKNLSVIGAADRLKIKNILFLTTVSGRAVCAQAFRENQEMPRTIQILNTNDKITGDIVFVSWAGINNPLLLAKLLMHPWQLIVGDEIHYAKNFTAKRTQNLFGRLQLDGRGLDQTKALVIRSERCWILSGTPVPHSLDDLYPTLRALMPEVLLAHNGWPDVTTLTAFKNRYCIMKPMRVSPWTTKWIVVGGRNEAELKARMNGKGFALRRTQAQIGILPPRYVTRPLLVDNFDPVVDGGMTAEEIEDIIASRRSENLAELMHAHGQIKASAVVEAVGEELECGLPKIVLAYHHRSVGNILREGLGKHGVTGIDGSTPVAIREHNVRMFSKPDGPRIFLQQIQAAGESIDLSAASVLWFVESVFQPAAMKQAGDRIINLNRNTAPLIEVTFIQGSIDKVIQERLMALWLAIRQVINT